MMRLVFMGTPEWAIPSLEGLLESGHELTGVLTQPDRYAGRNRVLAASPVKQEALKWGLQVFTPEKGDSPETFEVLKELNPDLILVCAYGQILPQDLIDLPRRGCFNLHFSLLPRWRGASPVQAAIFAGDRETGVSLQRMVLRLDAGPVVAESAAEPIRPDDTGVTLGARLSQLGGILVSETLPGLLEGSCSETPQDESRATRCRLIRKEDGRAVWKEEDALTLERKLRAYTPWPGLFCFGPGGKRLQIIRTEVVESNLEPGLVGEGLVIGTKRGGLKVLRLREEGKKELDAGVFLNGRSKLPGTRLN